MAHFAAIAIFYSIVLKFFGNGIPKILASSTANAVMKAACSRSFGLNSVISVGARFGSFQNGSLSLVVESIG